MPATAARCHKPRMTFPALPDPAADHELEHARRNPDRETLLLAAAGAAKALGARHSATLAFAKASITMAKVDLWHARLALKTLRRAQRCVARAYPVTG